MLQKAYGGSTDISKAWLKDKEQAVEALHKLAPEVLKPYIQRLGIPADRRVAMEEYC